MYYKYKYKTRKIVILFIKMVVLFLLKTVSVITVSFKKLVFILMSTVVLVFLRVQYTQKYKFFIYNFFIKKNIFYVF